MKRRVIASLAVLVSSSVIALGFEGHNLHASDSTDVLPAAGAALALEEGAAPEDTYVDEEDGTIVSKPSTNGVQSVNSVSVASTTESDNSLVLDTIGTSTVNVADIVADPIGDGADMAFLNNGNLEAAAKAQEEKDKIQQHILNVLADGRRHCLFELRPPGSNSEEYLEILQHLAYYGKVTVEGTMIKLAIENGL